MEDSLPWLKCLHPDPLVISFLLLMLGLLPQGYLRQMGHHLELLL